MCSVQEDSCDSDDSRRATSSLGSKTVRVCGEGVVGRGVASSRPRGSPVRDAHSTHHPVRRCGSQIRPGGRRAAARGERPRHSGFGGGMPRSGGERRGLHGAQVPPNASSRPRGVRSVLLHLHRLLSSRRLSCGEPRPHSSLRVLATAVCRHARRHGCAVSTRRVASSPVSTPFWKSTRRTL